MIGEPVAILRQQATYIQDEVRECHAYAWRTDDGGWCAKIPGKNRLTFGPYRRRNTAEKKAWRLVEFKELKLS